MIRNREVVKDKMEPLHDVKSAAKLLAVSSWTVRAYIRQGKLHPVRIGRLVRLDEEELARFVEKSRTLDQSVQAQAILNLEKENG
jgi:excisionase family DNA binding protein